MAATPANDKESLSLEDGVKEMFAPVSRSGAMKDGRMAQYYPTTADPFDGPYEFVISGECLSSYIRMPSIRLSAHCKIVKEDGTDLLDTDDVAPVNNFGTALFSSIEISIDGKQVPKLTTSNHGYKSYVETVLGYSTGSKLGHLKTSIWEVDSPKNMESFKKNPADGQAKNNGYISRESLGSKSKTFDIYTPLASDFLQCETPVMGGTEMKIKLIRAPNAFCLVTASDTVYRVHLSQMSIYVNRVSMDEEVVGHHQKRLTHTSIRYHFTHTDVKTFSMLYGQSTFRIPRFFDGHRLPKHITLGFVDSNAYHGSFKLNPWNFRNLDIEKINILFNGKSIPQNPYQPNFTENLYARSYRSALDNLGIGRANVSNGLTMDSFKYGTCLWPFDLSPDMCMDDCSHSFVSGTIEFNVSFRTTPTSNMTLLVFATQDDLIEVNLKTEVFEVVDF